MWCLSVITEGMQNTVEQVPSLWTGLPLGHLSWEEGSWGLGPEGLPGEATAETTLQNCDSMVPADKEQDVQGGRPLY